MKDLKELLNLVKESGYEVQENYINIIALRTSNKFTNKFDDVIFWYYRKEGEWVMEFAKCTTKAGATYVKNPINEKGVGILKPGFYQDCWTLGLHKSAYQALVQARPLTIWRDKNLDDIIDPVGEESDMIGLNVHRSSATSEPELVNNYSAACIVFQSPARFNKFILDIKNNVTKNGFYSLLLLDKPKVEKTELVKSEITKTIINKSIKLN